MGDQTRVRAHKFMPTVHKSEIREEKFVYCFDCGDVIDVTWGEPDFCPHCNRHLEGQELEEATDETE